MDEERTVDQVRLANAIDVLYRQEEGRYFFQYILGMCGLFVCGGTKDQELYLSGQRSIGTQMLNDMGLSRNGLAIKKAVLCKLMDEMEGKTDVEAVDDGQPDLLGYRG